MSERPPANARYAAPAAAQAAAWSGKPLKSLNRFQETTYYGGGERDETWESPTLARRDLNALRRLGKRPVLKRRFGFVSITGFCCMILISWETVLETLKFGLTNGGPAGLIYQYILVWFGVMATFVVIGELSSMAPIAGGQYHWVSILAPKRCHNFLSYLTGWLTLCGWQANTASGALLTSSLCIGMAGIINPQYEPAPWHLVLGAWATVAIAVLINTRGGLLLPRFEAAMLLLHIFGLFAVIIPLAVMAPKRSNEYVFGHFENSGQYPSQGLSFMVGIIGILWTFSGADGAIHLAEEIEGAQLVVPRAILSTYLIDGILGFVMIITITYCIQDTEKALATPTKYAFMEIFSTATNSKAGTVIMILIVVITQITATTSSLAAASRMCWSFSRDHGIPGWSLFSKVEEKTSVPVYAVMLTATISVLLQFINFGSEQIFEDLVSLTIAGLYSSYLIATSLLLYRRLKGRIGIFDDSSTALSNTVGADLSWGPWHIKGVAGLILNVFVCCFLSVAWFFSFWPMSISIQPEMMNYNSALWGAVVIFSVFYYFLKGRREYNGPIVEHDGSEDEPDRLKIMSADRSRSTKV